MSRKTNREPAKKTHRPMVEDELIASQLKDLLTPAITAIRKLLSNTRVARSDLKFALDGSGDSDTVMAGCPSRNRINEAIS